MKAVRFCILVRQVAPTKTTAGGIVLTQSFDTTYGEVVSVGADVTKEVSVGDQIVLNWQQTVPIKHESETFYALNQDAVLAVV